MQALDCDVSYGDGVAVLDGRRCSLDSVLLATHDLEAGNLAGDGVVASSVVKVLVRREHLADGHPLIACRFQHL